MSAVNPTAPAAGEIKFLSAEGRIGRIRYIGYSFGLGLILAAIELGIIIIYSVLGGHFNFKAQPTWFRSVTYVGDAVGLVFAFMFAIRRVRDFDVSGWLSVLILIPLVNIIFFIALMVIPGTNGSNRFGPRPPANSTGVIVLFVIWLGLIVLGVIGIIAAIAIPAYQHHLHPGQMTPAQYQMQQAPQPNQPAQQNLPPPNQQ